MGASSNSFTKASVWVCMFLCWSALIAQTDAHVQRSAKRKRERGWNKNQDVSYRNGVCGLVFEKRKRVRASSMIEDGFEERKQADVSFVSQMIARQKNPSTRPHSSLNNQKFTVRYEGDMEWVV
mmetsp:Transcript_78849/g.92155  ORF Transcript_78849/g.92155 Transcript_78849/m.92155 type:complete len:124 (+) Transcript_78849:824-1195(+)